MYYRTLLLVLSILFLLCAACNNDSSLPGTVTYAEHVAPILNKNCISCHRAGGSAHFSLTGYADAKKYSSATVYVTKNRIMPPWPADHHYTEFAKQRIMSNKDIVMLEKWVNDGTLMGPAEKIPATPEYGIRSEAGVPDMVIPVHPYQLSANSLDKFLLVKVPYELPNDTFASLIEFIPGKENVVHHVNGDMVKYAYEKKSDVFAGKRMVDMVEDTSSLRQAFEILGLPNDDGTYPVLQKSVVNYLPGVFGQKYPAGLGGYKLPRKGAFLLNDIHYGFNNKEAITDSSHINIYFSKIPPERPVKEFQLGTLGISPVEPNLIIEPNTIKNVCSKYKIPADISVLTINPHMHLLGKSFKAYALKPNGDTIRLISIPIWDFNWQYFYTFKKMIKIPAGSTIIAEGVYDNTKQNLNNPFSPPQMVSDRDGSMKATDEMFQFIVTYLPYVNGDEQISLE